ncbi:hypothetical protein H6F75_22350 [Nodosilinea sp. FACHB-131]|uniref:hypothetical protein n=1 Tax=Cyanophyceae TaxID=3028117 RepID=UPI0016827B65|nr:hypothetical protein [Nodosilinea sp. FACHB-131]MBD1876231.1 hypothetical protein [Nodosilinea sp. FACHB-131]
MSILDPCKECGCGRIEWMDRYCQECWEALCAREWWLMIEQLDETEVSSDG